MADTVEVDTEEEEEDVIQVVQVVQLAVDTLEVQE